MMPAFRIRASVPIAPENRMAERVDYVYRGTGEDIMPWAIVPKVNDQVVRTGPGRRMTTGDRRCAKCGFDRRSKTHRQQCRKTNPS